MSRVETAEYLIRFWDSAEQRAQGRTQDATLVPSTVAQWLDNPSIASLYADHPFVDQRLRAHRALESTVRAALAGHTDQLRLQLEDPTSEQPELWLYTDQRACRLEPLIEGTLLCRLLLHTTTVLRIDVESGEAAAALAADWLLACPTIRSVQERFPNAIIAPYAERLEAGDVAGWRWAHRSDWVSRQTLISFPLYQRLFTELQQHPSVMRFFTFPSLGNLCFSLCSHFPYETRGLPRVMLWKPPGVSPHQPTEEFHYVVETLATHFEGDERIVTVTQHFEGDARETANFLETVLSQIKTTPWHGIDADAFIAPLNTAFATRGIPLRARRQQRKQWWNVVVEHGDTRVVLGSPRDDFAFCGLWNQSNDAFQQADTVDDAVTILTGWLLP